MTSDVSVSITSSISAFSFLFVSSLLLLIGADELSSKERKETEGRGGGIRRQGGSIKSEHGIRNKCVSNVVLSKNANETNSDCNARAKPWHRTCNVNKRKKEGKKNDRL